MDNYYPYTDEEIQAAAKARKVRALHSAILLHRERYQLIKDWRIATPHDIESIKVLLKIYGWELAKLDPKYFNDNLAILPAL